MKTTSLKQKLAGLLARLSLVTAISLFSLACTAQSVWEASEVKGNTMVFKCRKNMGTIYIHNSMNIDPRKGREHYNHEVLEYSNVRLVSHDAILDAFKKAFTEEEIRILSELKERVSIFVDVGEKGQILDLSFSIKEGTIILPANMESLENELQKNMQFEVIGKKADSSIFYSKFFRVHFTEVQDGEIRMVRNSVNLKNEY